MKHRYDLRTKSIWVLFGNDTEDPGQPSMMLSIQNGVPTTDPTRVLLLMMELLAHEGFVWDRCRGGKNLFFNNFNMELPIHEEAVLGALQPDPDSSFIASIQLRYPKGMSVLNALDQIEVREDGDVPPFLMAALLIQDYALRQYEIGNMPAIMIGYPQRNLAQIIYQFLPYNPHGQPIPPRKTDEEIKRIIQNIPLSAFDGSMTPDPSKLGIDKATSKPSVKQDDAWEHIFPGITSWRGIDIANLLWKFALYLWSQEWWGSQRMRLYARSLQTLFTQLISSAMAVSLACRKPIFTIDGYEFAVGSPRVRENMRDYPNPRSVEEQYKDPLIESMLMIWYQLVEFYSMDATAEVLRELIPDRVLVLRKLGVDVMFDVSQTIEQLHWGKSNLLERAEQNAAYTPTGCFRLNLPDELLDEIRRLELRPEDDPDGHEERQINLSFLVLSVDAEGIWARLVGQKGPGPIVRWRPGKPMQTNLISASFGTILDIVFAALWHDMRVAGEESVRISERRTGRRHGRSKGAGAPAIIRTVVTVPHRKVVYLSGQREWSTEEERQTIKRIAHGVMGHRRTLPAGWQPSERARQLAENAGIHLPPGVTYVSPFTRGGKDDGDIDAAPVIISKGLAMIMAFLTKEEQKKQ